MKRIPINKIVKIKIGYGETKLRQRIKAFDAIWNKTEKVWQVKYEIVKNPGLTERMIDNK